MKKTLLATALLAGFAGAGVAHAQSSVTLYGIVDVGIGGGKIDGQESTLGMDSGLQSGSRWGLRGSEDLGNGLRANFKLESGFNSNNGTRGQGGRMFGREAWAGLSGNFGEVRVGRQEAAQYQMLKFISPFGTSFGQAGIGEAFNGVSTNRADNTVSYLTPNFSGFQAMAGYSFNYDGGSEAEDASNRLWSLGIKYENGPIAVGVGYEGTDLGRDTAWYANQNGKDPYNYTIGGTYDFNVVKLYAGFSQMKHGYTNPVDSTDWADIGRVSYFPGDDVNAYQVGLSAPLGNGELMANWQMTDPDIVGLANEKQNTYSLGYTYNLSKRTNLYAFYSYADGAWYDENWDAHAYAVGLRHRF